MSAQKQQDQCCKSQLRKDPTSGRWSIVQMQGPRYKRCSDYFLRERDEFQDRHCVFARQFSGGRRQEKKPLFGLRWHGDQVEITYGNWHSDDWEVMLVQADHAQVVPGKEKVLLGEDPFVAEAGCGIHELIIEDPSEEHLPLGLMPNRRTQLILLAMLYRLNGHVEGFPPLDKARAGEAYLELAGRALSEIDWIRHVSFFHNHRPESGGSQEHPHSQIIASPIIPTDVAAELEYVLRRHERPPRRCVYCEIIEAELSIRDSKSAKQRVLFETRYFVAIQPHCSIYPFETWILPKRHTSSFGDLRTTVQEGTTSELADLSELIDSVVGRLYACLDDPGYNLIIKSQPTARSDEITKYSFYHWHIRIEPRGMITTGGYELSTGIFNAQTPPEETTTFLQEWGHLSHSDPRKRGTIEWYLQVIELLKARLFAGNAEQKGSARGDVSDLLDLTGLRDDSADWAYVETVPRYLRNVLTILGTAARNLRVCERARAILDDLSKFRPDLFLTQVEPPPESKQGLKTMEQAGDFDGPHYRCCPSTGRWVLIPSTARRRGAAGLKKKQEKKRGPRWLPDDSEDECGLCKPLDHQNRLICGLYKTEEGSWRTVDVQTLCSEDQWKRVEESGCVSFVIQNKNPFLLLSEEADFPPVIGGLGPFEEIDGVGICEVIGIGISPAIMVEGKHSYRACIDREHLESALAAVFFRTRELACKLAGIRNPCSPVTRHISIFSNHRSEAGAKLAHLNWQMIAAPIVPTGVAQELEHGQCYFEEYSGRCCFCDMIQAERRRTTLSPGKRALSKDDLGTRVIMVEDSFVALTPYASRVPFEVWILPLEHQCRIENSLGDVDKGTLDQKRVTSLARLLSYVLCTLEEQLADPGYSLIIKNAPISPPGYDSFYQAYHWRIIIETQKLAVAAGYEHLTGIWSNVVPPEEAAAELRQGGL